MLEKNVYFNCLIKIPSNGQFLPIERRGGGDINNDFFPKKIKQIKFTIDFFQHII
jgi:hypothetical protein